MYGFLYTECDIIVNKGGTHCREDPKVKEKEYFIKKEFIMFEGPFDDMFDINGDGVIDPGERMLEYMVYRDINGSEDEDEDEEF